MADDSDYEDDKGPSQSKADYEKALKDVREREKELSKRTELLENMVRMLTSNLGGAQHNEPSTSNQMPQTAPPPLHFSTPLTNPYTSTGSPMGITFPSGFSKSYLRDALELVPKYDGHNIPIWQFARACKRAKETVPLIDEALFVRMLRNKLTHHAYLAVEDEIHATVDKFLDVLKRTFGSNRSANYYRGQLSIAYKKPAEHILDYIGRIKDLRTAVIEGDQTSFDRTLNEAEVTSIDSYALEAFYEGLPREYRTELRAEGYSNFTDACTKVITIDKRLEREEARYRNSRTPRDNTQPQIQRQATENGSNLAATTNNTGGQKICSYCKKMGHLIHECRKRQFNEHRFNNNSSNGNNSGPRGTGNDFKAPVDGTNRGLGAARPIHLLGCPHTPSTSSEETTVECLQSN